MILFVSLFPAVENVEVEVKCINSVHCYHHWCLPNQMTRCILGKCYCLNRAKNPEHARNDRRNSNCCAKINVYGKRNSPSFQRIPCPDKKILYCTPKKCYCI
ncbi:hypothetical protein P8452_55343 [Trifolium repens]|nr:hypothetical protein P8452_55343 [Trifolium repens]